MALITKDRVLETSTTTGTGDITLAGALLGFRSFGSVCSVNDTLYYLIEAVDGNGFPTGDWETGLGTYSAANTLTRTTVLASSNGGSAVSFAAGNKRVSACSVAQQIANGVKERPGGRLTLTSGTPVLTADATAQSTIYYTPYVNDIIPIFMGDWVNTLFSELTLTLDTTNHVSGSLYDVFVWNNGGTVSIGTGPAWSSTTSRGTGAGTTELQLKSGIWTNANSITLNNGAGSGTTGIAANTATYVGTFYATANGQTGMLFKPAAAAGGTNNFLALYNGYNRTRVGAICRDSTTSWTYAAGTWRASNNSASNRISFVDGLRQSVVHAKFHQSSSGSVTNTNFGVSLDSTTTAPDTISQTSPGTSSAILLAVTAEYFFPQLGLHFCQEMEKADGSHTATIYGQNVLQHLVVELEM